MPAFKLTTDLYLSEKLDSRISENVKHTEIWASLLGLLNANNARDQIGKLKTVAQELTKICQGEGKDSYMAIEQALNFLVHLFFISTSKNPARRVLVSIFQSLPAHVRSSVIDPAIKEAVLKICKQPIRSCLTDDKSQPSFDETLAFRHDVDTILAVMENFPLGEECMQAVCVEVLTFLAEIQGLFFSTYRSPLSPVQQNEVMHHCLETVKLANRVCQKSSVTMATQLQDSSSLDSFTLMTSKFLKMDLKILKTEEFLIDCKMTSSMNIWLLLKLCLDQDCLMKVITSTIFQHVNWLQRSENVIHVPSWLQNLSIETMRIDSLSDTSYLCLCYGSLFMVPLDILVLPVDGKCLLLDALFPEFLRLCRSCTDIGSKLLAAKSVTCLTQRLRELCMEKSHLPEHLATRLHGTSDDMKAFLDFVWTTWEDSVDAIRYTVKDIFENVLLIHQSTSKDPVAEDPFLRKLAKSLLHEVSWSCKGKYPTLAILVSHMGSAVLLELHPGIAEDVLEQMQEHTLACYASDLYEKLFTSQLDAHVADPSVWYSQWLDPVLRVLCGTSVLQKKHTIEYILPKLLKTGSSTLQYIVNTLTVQLVEHRVESSEPAMERTHKQTGGQLGALIMCLRRACALGLLKSGQTAKDAENTDKLWCGFVDVDLLKQALMCRDEQIRLDAFALLCENQRTSEPIDSVELRQIQAFIPQNLNNQNPAFRQHFLSLLKKFLSRMKESNGALNRKLSKDRSLQCHLRHYQDLLFNLTRLMFGNLYPGSTFARRTTCLGVLSLIGEIFGMHATDGDFDFYSMVRDVDVKALLFCLTDTFEDNKSQAASLLVATATKGSSAACLDQSAVLELFDIGITLSQSTRPQDSTTGAYLFSVLTHQPCFNKVLKDYLHSMSAEKKYSIEGKEGTVSSNSTSVVDTDELSDVTNTIPVKDQLEGVSRDIGQESSKEADDMHSELERRYLLLKVLMKNLELQSETARQSLVVAAANNPMYPTLQCIRYCFESVDFRKIPRVDQHFWKLLLSKFILLFFGISDVVSPIVCNSSPEGNVPVESITGLGNIGLSMEEDLSRSHETVMLMPEYLIVCCWRSVKEISLVLGHLTATVPIQEPGSMEGLLTFEQVIRIGEFFTVLLLESKHRGAFELAYAGFVRVTEMLWRSRSSQLHQLPKKWLQDVMMDIKSNDPDSRLCATRRSAGLPFYVQALATTEPPSTGRQCFKQTMQELLTLALDETVVTQDKCTAKVHALNILRAMYKDSRLKDDVNPFIADGLRVAILGFKSPLWAVRNSATLLMTAMMTRIFGVKRSKDETTFSRKNCQTGRTFFYNYPSLYQFLLEEISAATENVSSQLHPGLFPILMVLGRLFPSSMEGTDTSLNLAAFIPFVIRCSANPVLKTRVMAAKALQPLVEKDHVTTVFCDLLSLLPSRPGDPLKQNQVHGVLLQLVHLMKTVSSLPRSVQMDLRDVVKEMWKPRFELLVTRKNPCLLTRKVALEVSSLFIKHLDLQDDFKPALVKVLTEEMAEIDTAYDPCLPSLSEFQLIVIHLYFELCVLTVDQCDMQVKQTKVTNNLDKTRVSVRDAGMAEMTELAKDSKDSKEVLQQTVCKEIVSLTLKCLASESYDVRWKVLEELLGIVSSQEETTTGIVTEANKCGQISLNRERIGSVLLQSDRLKSQLLGMLDSETHEECQIQLFGLLEKLLEQGVEFSSLETVIVKLLQRLKSDIDSDRLKSALILLAGATLNQLSKHPTAREDAASATSVQPVLRSFLDVVRELTSQMETDTDLLMACARALLANCQSFMEDGCLNPAGRELRTSVYLAITDLLQADDISVRETAASVVDLLTASQNKVQTHPNLALTNLLDHWILHSTDKDEVMTDMFELMFEEKDSKQLIDSCLDRFLNLKAEHAESSRLSDLLSRREILVKFSRTPMTLRDVFIHTQSYQKSVLNTFQVLALCRYISRYSKDHYTDLVPKSIKDCREKSSKSAWISVLEDFLMENSL